MHAMAECTLTKMKYENIQITGCSSRTKTIIKRKQGELPDFRLRWCLINCCSSNTGITYPFFVVPQITDYPFFKQMEMEASYFLYHRTKSD